MFNSWTRHSIVQQYTSPQYYAGDFSTFLYVGALKLQHLCIADLLYTVFWGVVSHLAFLPLIPYLHQGLKE